MSYRRKKPTILHKILSSYIFQGCLVILIGILAIQVYERYTVERSAADRRAEAESEVTALQMQHDDLAAQVAGMRDSFGIEAEIRRNFDVAKEGEQIVIILDDDLQTVPVREGPADSSQNTSASEQRPPWYIFW